MKKKKLIRTKRRKIKSQGGQFVIEAILVMFLFVGMSTVLMTKLKENNLLGRLVANPWERVAGMMGTGHWEPVASAKATGKLPHQRTTTREGDD